MKASELREVCLAAARATLIPAGESGLWRVSKFKPTTTLDLTKMLGGLKPKHRTEIRPGIYTILHRLTQATMHHLGECVMNDYNDELVTHLDFMLKARGRVLITGLGLGCVARGTLANPAVEHVTIVERDEHVLKLVAPYMDERFEIVHADALEFLKTTTRQFDCAWHDLWSDPDKGEKHLQLMHADLMIAGMDKTKFQGAWQFPRRERRVLQRMQLPIL